MTRRQRLAIRRQRNAVSPTGARRRCVAAAAGVAVAASLALAASAQATPFIFTVNTTADSNDGFCTAGTSSSGPCSLRDALNSAESGFAAGSTIQFAPNVAGTITLGSALPTVTQQTTIAGPGADKLTVSGNEKNQILAANGAGTPGLSLSGLTLSGGVASYGAAIGADSTDITVDESVVSGNSGSAIATVGGNVSISNSRLSGNNGSQYPGAISDKSANVTVTDSQLDSNSTSTSGGAIAAGGLCAKVAVTIRGSTIAGNTAGNGGGGLEISCGTAAIEGSTIAGNTAYAGGGIYAASNTSVDNSTISGNIAAGEGGGILIGDNPLTVRDTTIVRNGQPGLSGSFHRVAVTSGGGIAASSPVTLEDVIVAGNDESRGPDLYADADGSFSSAFSLIKDPSGATVTETVPGSDIIGQDPQLGPLTNNGGPTQTMKPAASSPVVDRGKSFGLTSDQRGDPRPYDNPQIPNSAAAGADGSDIGAVELQAGEIASEGAVPDTKITKAKVSSKHHRASFSFRAVGSATGFQCALVRRMRSVTKRKHHKKAKPSFSSCTSPKKFKHLQPGRYRFYVRAFNAAGSDSSPAQRSFTIG